ncbi:MAG: SPOR domain-containing protein [Bacteroides sp.]|nr:SPOR domain-containing protein [Bacteroides sp.]
MNIKHLSTAIAFMLFSITCVKAQSIIDSLQAKVSGQGHITIKQDASVESLMKKLYAERGSNIEMTGYRVQAYLGTNSRQSKDEAQRIAERIKNKYPDLKVYAIFKKPRWVCLVGNYRNIEEADKTMRLLKKEGLKEAAIIKDRIIINIE